MNEEIRQCKKCQRDFILEVDDFSFYKKMDVPVPNICPDCRFKMRAVWRNEHTLYNRTCGLCNRSIISMYNPKSPYIVYCNECWISDKWDPFSYAIDYDPSKPFFEQFGKLMKKVPRECLSDKNSINCSYSTYSGNNKNCYFIGF